MSIPLSFLRHSKSHIGQATFEWNKQQDVSEVLQHLLTEVRSICLPAYQRLTVSVVSTITCDTCYESSISEQDESILTVPMGGNIQECVQKYLAPVQLSAWKCPCCNVDREATKTTHFANASDVLILQMKRFSVVDNTSIQKSCAYSTTATI